MNRLIKTFMFAGALLFSFRAFAQVAAQVGVVTETNSKVTLQRGE